VWPPRERAGRVSDPYYGAKHDDWVKQGLRARAQARVLTRDAVARALARAACAPRRTECAAARTARRVDSRASWSRSRSRADSLPCTARGATRADGLVISRFDRSGSGRRGRVKACRARHALHARRPRCAYLGVPGRCAIDERRDRGDSDVRAPISWSSSRAQRQSVGRSTFMPLARDERVQRAHWRAAAPTWCCARRAELVTASYARGRLLARVLRPAARRHDRAATVRRAVYLCAPCRRRATRAAARRLPRLRSPCALRTPEARDELSRLCARFQRHAPVRLLPSPRAGRHRKVPRLEEQQSWWAAGWRRVLARARSAAAGSGGAAPPSLLPVEKVGQSASLWLLAS
jgi:hypothetical protein